MKRGTADKGGRGKGRAPKVQKTAKKSGTKAKKPTVAAHEIYDADMDTRKDRRRNNVELVKVRDYASEIDSDDDEEIDSDGAFNESDEERFSNFQQFFKSKDREEGADSDHMDTDDEEEEGDLVDLSEMLDAGSDDEEDKEEQKEESSSDELDGFGSDSDSDAMGSDDEHKLEKLDGFVTSISARAPKRRYISETGMHAENTHAVGSGLSARGISLGLNDLLGQMDEDSMQDGEAVDARGVQQLRDQVKTMQTNARRAGAGVVTAPVARRLQDQMDRSVAYVQTKKSVSEWQPTVSANREAEHLSFPLNQPNVAPTTKALADIKSSTPMESQIQSILEQSGMTDEQQRQYEELELQSQTPEEIRARQRELRLMRDLMFRSERKAKRSAKIKSKVYHRILKKEKLRGQEKALEQMQTEDPEMYAMLVEKMARNRAEERMTLRHKNTGKWAQAMSRRSHDEGAQQMLREQLEQHDSLKRKIYDIESDDDVADYEAGQDRGSDGESDDGTFEGIRKGAIDQLGAESDDEVRDTPHKALFDMKFMRSAMQRKQDQADEDVRLARAEFEALEADVDDEGGVKVNRTAAVKAARDVVAPAGAPGRMSFGGGLAATEDVEQPSSVQLDEHGTIGQVASGAGHRVRLDGPLSVTATPNDADQNPWLDSKATATQRGDSSVLSKDSTRLDKLSARLREKRANTRATASGAMAESVLLDVSQTLHAKSNDDVEMQHISNPNAFTQRELVEQAFAEDNVVEAEFAQEKEDEEAADAPQDEDLTLPGWGSWGGAKIAPRKNKIVRKAVNGVTRANRTDANMGSVIINQRQQKTATKYYASSVPFPYYSGDQYEASMQAPLGKEWNTTKSHAKIIKPRVLTKSGRIIDPISIPSKRRQ
ncbi:hypothetical protein IWW56_000154 [Coemansia sp. RSA 2131]|nr:hypothetical protein IWW56_000154 [Coemansia sp. RSA 2131]